MSTLQAIALIAGPALAALAVTLVNLFTWSRGRPHHRATKRVSVLVPARNEAHDIARCVRAIFASTHPIDEVVVYDDRSQDDTRAVLAALETRFSRLRVLDGGRLPPGWVGKPHACHRMAEAARGELLVFVDADTVLAPEGLARLLSFLEHDDLVTAVPRQKTQGVFERLIVPLLHLTYLSWLPLALVRRVRDPRVLAANGQLMAMRREALEAAGGFAAVRADIVDDMALARRFKEAGLGVSFADGHRMASCRMYTCAREVWEGFSKNLYEGIGAHPAALAGVVALYVATFLVPWIVAALAAFGAVSSAAALGALLGIGANLVQRVLLAARFRQPPVAVALHPFAILALLAIAFNSALWHARGAIRWAGRTYPTRAVRQEESR